MHILFHAHYYGDRWTVQTHAEDAKTSTGPFIDVRDESTLLRLLRYVGASEADVEEAKGDLRGRGILSTWVDIIPGRKNLLRLKAPWNEGLVDAERPPA